MRLFNDGMVGVCGTMIEGYNEGWIDFGGVARSLGRVPLEAVLKELAGKANVRYGSLADHRA
jgi:hypothetical protein